MKKSTKSTKSNIISKSLVGIGLSIMLVISSFANAGSVTYYKSVGASGETKFSQFPPANTEDYDIITMRSDGRQEDAGKLASNVDGDGTPKALNATEQQLKVLEDRINRQEEQDKIRKCQALRNNLTNLNIGGKIYEMRDGKKEYLDDSQIQKKRDTIQNAINQYCEKPSA